MRVCGLGSAIHPWPIEAAGWLNQIGTSTSRLLDVTQVLDLPYQLIHRTASACSVQRPTRSVVYQVFGSGPVDYYVNSLAELWRLLSASPLLAFHVLACPLEKLPAYVGLEERWRRRDPAIASAVRSALLAGPRFSFGEPVPHAVFP